MKLWKLWLICGALLGANISARAQNAAPKPLTPDELSNIIDGPTLVSLHFKNAPIEDVLKELSRQSGMMIGFDPHAKKAELETLTAKPVSIDVDKMPFWSALRTLTSQIDVVPSQAFGGDLQRNVVSLMLGDNYAPLRGLAQETGPFLIIAQQIVRQKKADLSGTAPPEDQLMISALMFVDPKVRLDFLFSAIRFSQVVDETGASLLDKQPQGDASSQSPLVFLVAPVLNLQGVHGQRIALLRGTIPVKVLIKRATWEIPFADALKARDFQNTLAGHRVLLHLMPQKSGELQATLTIFHAQSQQGQLQPKIMLLDEHGREFSNDSGAESSAVDRTTTDEKFNLKSDFGPQPEPPKPTKFIIEIPLETREVLVPFEFRDLPLP